MATLRTARQTYKNSRVTTDAWFVRIERRDNKVIRFTNAVENVLMSSRHKGDGTTEALATPVTYYSASGYTPTAVGITDGMQPGTIDLEGLLDAVSIPESSSAEVTQIDPTATGIRAPTTKAGGGVVTTLLDGNYGTLVDPTSYWNPEAPITSNTDTALEYIELDFKVPAIFNRVRIYADQSSFIGVKRSDDGMRYDEVVPLVEYAPVGTAPNAYFDITLPYDVKTRFLRLILGNQTTGLPGSTLNMRQIELYRDETKTATGTLTRSDIELGLYANAKIRIFLTDYTDPYEDDERLFAGYLGSIALLTGTYVAELNSLQSMLNHPTGRRLLPTCDTLFGSFRCGIHLDPPAWNNKIYAKPGETSDRAKGTWVKPSVDNGLYYWADTEGAVGASEPSWNTTVGGSTSDGSTNWIGVRAYRVASTVDGYAKAGYQITVGDLALDANGTWDNGKVEFTDGDLKGVVVSIASQIGSTLTLAQPLKVDPSFGDGIIVTMGCKKRFSEDCLTKYLNSKNFQGFPNVPGGKIATQRFVSEGD